jgi:hypothetical protein
MGILRRLPVRFVYFVALFTARLCDGTPGSNDDGLHRTYATAPPSDNHAQHIEATLQRFWWLNKSWLSENTTHGARRSKHKHTHKLLVGAFTVNVDGADASSTLDDSVCAKPPAYAKVKHLAHTLHNIPHPDRMRVFLTVNHPADFPLVMPSFLPGEEAEKEVERDIRSAKKKRHAVHKDVHALWTKFSDQSHCKKRTHYFYLDRKAGSGGIGSKLMGMIKPLQMCLKTGCVVDSRKLPFYASHGCTKADFTCFFKPIIECPPLSCKPWPYEKMVSIFSKDHDRLPLDTLVTIKDEVDSTGHCKWQWGKDEKWAADRYSYSEHGKDVLLPEFEHRCA